MLISKYTFLFDYDNEFYIYNTLSNALMKIDDISYLYLLNVQQGKGMIDKRLIDKELLHVLTKKHFVTNNEKDELLLYKSIIHSVRDQKEYMHLTIAPTMDCNFHCHYCFEKNKKTGYMSESIMDGIVSMSNR